MSPDTFARRVRNRFTAGDIDLETALKLMVQNEADGEGRQNTFWFLCTRGLLTTPGVTDLFTWWGGEALYTCHDRDPTTGPVLVALGRPCIVEFRIPYSSMTASPTVEDTLTRVFQLRSGIDDGEQAGCSGHVRDPIDRTCVRRIITADDPAFAELMGFGTA